ncbi:hypothetical protein [Embleya sp. NBC_00896]|uniref:hypothetical protein n=1 Tax=Embleya sp. NBC_00896 TaxID=2975961 RepID=UPI002F90F9A8|nr:hypothetical protein OG928_33800 [Embleya sp. NBC_00896]
MHEFSFELQPVPDGRSGELHGTIGPFGEVSAYCTDPRSTPNAVPHNQIVVVGAEFPETEFTGRGLANPSLDCGLLKMDGVIVAIDLRVRGIRKGSRWLDITHQDRHYKYTSTGNYREAELRRDGVRITIGRGRHIRSIGHTRAGKAEGAVDPTDLAIAIVLEAANTEALTLGGALLAIPRKILFESGSEGAPA